MSVETFMLNLGFRVDEKVRELSIVGRLTFIQAAAAFDGNWGHAIYNPTVIVAAAWPIEQALADDGDEDAEALIAEAKRELRKAVDLGLFTVGEAQGVRVVAYNNWERYNKNLRDRGAPHDDGPPMTPEIARSRNWSNCARNSRDKLLGWAERCDLLTIVRKSIADAEKARHEAKLAAESRRNSGTATAPPRHRHGTATAPPRHRHGTATAAPTPAPETAPAPAPESPSVTACADERADALPSTVAMPTECAKAFSEATGLHYRTAYVNWRRACVPNPKLTDLLAETSCESVEQWMLGLAFDVRAAAKWPDYRQRNIADWMRDRCVPTELSRARAAKWLSGDDDKPAKTRPELVVDYSGDDGWGSRE